MHGNGSHGLFALFVTLSKSGGMQSKIDYSQGLFLQEVEVE